MSEIKKNIQNIDRTDYIILTAIYTISIISTMFLVAN